MTAIRILLAEDHTLVRAGIRALLEQIGDIVVVGEAGDGPETLRLLAEQQPDIVLLDITMAGLTGLEVLAMLPQHAPAARAIILSMHASEGYVLQAIRAGAAGYLLKDSATAELELAVRAVSRGETYLSPAVSKHVIAELVQRSSSASRAIDRLTPRQRETLRLIAEGQTMQEIAQTLQISVKTAEAHRAQLMERLGIHDVASLVRLALREGLITPE